MTKNQEKVKIVRPPSPPRSPITTRSSSASDSRFIADPFEEVGRIMEEEMKEYQLAVRQHFGRQTFGERYFGIDGHLSLRIEEYHALMKEFIPRTMGLFRYVETFETQKKKINEGKGD